MANCLFVAGECFRDARGRFPTGRGQENLAATEHKGIRGTQPGGSRLLFLFGRVADKNACFHGSEYTTSQITSLENALEHDGLQAEGGFLGLLTVGNQAGHQVNQEIDGAAMARVFDLADVFELIVDGLDDGRLRKSSLSESVSSRLCIFLRSFVMRRRPWVTRSCSASGCER